MPCRWPMRSDTVDSNKSMACFGKNCSKLNSTSSVSNGVYGMMLSSKIMAGKNDTNKRKLMAAARVDTDPFTKPRKKKRPTS